MVICGQGHIFFFSFKLYTSLDILDACGQIHRLRSCAALSTYFLAVLGRYYAGFSLVAGCRRLTAVPSPVAERGL